MKSSLRPENFEEFIGQSKLKENLKIMIVSATERKKQIDHVLLFGPPGLGKTTLAILIAAEMNCRIKFAQGPMLEKKSDILSLFGSIAEGDVIFIDEIHGINKNVEELLYSALEEGVVDVVVGVEGESKIMRMKLPRFTLIGATTRVGKISTPLKDRFGFTGKLMQYEAAELQKIISNSAKTLKIKIEKEAIEQIAFNSRGVPRVANNLLKRVNDYRVYKNEVAINKQLTLQAFAKFGLYRFGLTDIHVDYLKILGEVFYEKYASLDAISGILLEEANTIEQEIEPILLSLNLIQKSSRGRMLTLEGVKYITNYNIND